MFGTLVIQLPSDYEGGQLQVCHQGKKLTFDFSGTKGSAGYHYAAFYADCQHELCEVTKGYRLCLIYNLVYSRASIPPVPADNRQPVDQVVAAMREWSKDTDGPPVLAYRLSHKYCEASLSFRALKNTDRAMAEVLKSAQKQEGFYLYLGIVTLSQHWSACGDYCYYGGSSYEVDDLIDEELTTHNLVSPTGETMEAINLDKEYVMPEDGFDDDEPDDEEFEEATGNEGATVERRYQDAALLMWPKEQRIAVMGIDAVISELRTSCTKASSRKPEDHMWKESLTLAQELVVATKHASNEPSCDAATMMLSCLCILSDPQLACEFLQALSVKPTVYTHSTSFAKVLNNAGNKLGWDHLQPALKMLFEVGVAKDVEASCKFLVLLSTETMTPQKLAVGQQLADAFCKALASEQDISTTRTHHRYWSKPVSKQRTRSFVCQVFKVLSTFNCDQQLQGVLTAFFRQPNRYSLTNTLSPAAEELHQWVKGDSSPLYSLLSHCVTKLEQSTRVELVPKGQSWSRKPDFTCSCADCTELATFLKDPMKQVIRFRRKQSYRTHLERQLWSMSDDVTHITERVGSPHTLVITKTVRAYAEKVRERQAGLDYLARIRPLLAQRGGSQPPLKRARISNGDVATGSSSSDAIVVEP